MCVCVCVCVRPRTVDIDCAGDRLRHISTQLAPAAEKHINWLHWEPCLVTMAKHTRRRRWWRRRRRRRRVETGSGFSEQSLRNCLSQTLFSFPPAMSVIFALPLSPSFELTDPLFLSLSCSLSLSLALFCSHTYKHNLHISFSSLAFSLLTLTSSICPYLILPPYPTTLCNIICLALICLSFFLAFFPPISVLSLLVWFPYVESHRKDKRGLTQCGINSANTDFTIITFSALVGEFDKDLVFTVVVVVSNTSILDVFLLLRHFSYHAKF